MTEKPNDPRITGMSGLPGFLTRLATLPIPDGFAKPEVPEVNHAEWTYERLGEYIKAFENDLDDEHEIGARLVSFGQSVTFHIENMGYWGPDIINFYGVNTDGEKVQLIQHISQLSVLLVAMKKLGEKPRRIGFQWDHEDSKRV